MEFRESKKSSFGTLIIKLLKSLLYIFIAYLLAHSLLIIFMPLPQPLAFQRDKVDVIAHQGGNLESPDATFNSFDHAVAVEADVLELDVHLSRDGHLIVMHDEAINRTTDGKGLIRAKTLADLKQVDAAYWWPYHSNDDVEKQNVPPAQQFPYRGAGIEIPTLNELFQRYPDKRFVIELKDNSQSLRDELLNKISEYHFWDRVLIASVYQDTLEAIRNSEPRAQTYGAESEIRLFYIMHLLHLEKLYPYKLSGFAVPMTSGGINLATDRFIQAAKNAGLVLHYWTINKEADMKMLLDMGVDGIITDKPELLMSVIRES